MSTEYPSTLPKTLVTHSLLKSFRRCPRVSLYKHHDLLAPKEVSVPLRRGTWVHALLEAHYSGEDWREVHKQFTLQFTKLFDEEKEKLGDLPTECAMLMRAYLWHYKYEAQWTVHEVEFKLEATLPNGVLWQGKSDMLIEDQDGLLWIVDHKTNKMIPSLTHRLLDTQSILYIWACRENGIPVQGFIWNYIKTSAPKTVRVNANGKIAANQGLTDYRTAFASLKQNGHDVNDPRYKPYLLSLKKMQYRPDEPQLSPFFQRTVMEKSDAMIERALAEATHTAGRYRDYDFEDRDAVERVPDKSCDWCSYRNLCTTELVGGNAAQVIRQEFMKQDPLYYYDQDPLEENK